MPVLSVDDLLQYTEWERGKWQAWFRKHGTDALKAGAGAHGDGRFQSVGDVVRHIFAAEKRYVERLKGQPLTDPSSIPSDRIDTLFEFGMQCRKEFQDYIAAFPEQDWDKPKEYNMMNMTVKLSAKKIIFQVLIHETRHWAQVATMLRLQGFPSENQDFLLSPVWGS